MKKVVVDCAIPFIEGVLESYARVVYRDAAQITAADVHDADALVVRTRTRCDAALLAGSAVKIIVTATIGFDHIDMDYCRANGIRVATCAGCNARGVLQWMGAALGWLAAHGKIAAPQQTTLGVVGVGNVGSLVARYAALWGFDVLCCDPLREQGGGPGQGLYTPVRFVSQEEVARRSDIVTLHVPLTRAGGHATYHMAGAAFLGSLKPGAIVVNSSRGEIIDGDALLRAARSGACECVIDTWEHEPQPDPQLIGAALLATPHIAGYSLQGKANATAMAAGALARYFGWPLGEWYPPEAGRPVPPSDIAWGEMLRRMPRYFDIEALSHALKAAPQQFESMRTGYAYRQEFF